MFDRPVELAFRSHQRIDVLARAVPFELRGNGNADLGAVGASGVWLGENGKAGSLQEIDLTV